MPLKALSTEVQQSLPRQLIQICFHQFVLHLVFDISNIQDLCRISGISHTFCIHNFKMHIKAGECKHAL